MGKHENLDGRTRVARHRAAMRAKGYRLKQFWVPDVRSPEFREQIAREVAAINASAHAADDQAFIDSVTDWEGLPPYDAPLRNDGSSNL
jgi:surfactin synthase thioesterase subunit